MANAGRTKGRAVAPGAVAPRAAETRRRLVAAAAQVMHELGYANTTLARVAKAARVPVGNVYYYFKTKDSLAEAVIDSYVDDLRARFAEHEHHGRPEDRIASLLAATGSRASCRSIAKHGCPHGSLAQELDKGNGRLGRAARRLVEAHLEWFEAQFRAMGRGARARALALELFAGIQGAALVGNALSDPLVIEERLRALARWVRGLARK